MDQLEKIKEQAEIGQQIFVALFNMDLDALRDKLVEICNNQRHTEVIEGGTIIKITHDDTPEEIKINFYGGIVSATFAGITFKPEHGAGNMVVKFNKFFTLGEVEEAGDHKLINCLTQIENCLEDAPVDFLGTGSSASAAAREEVKWRKKWESSISEAKEIIKNIPK